VRCTFTLGIERLRVNFNPPMAVSISARSNCRFSIRKVHPMDSVFVVGFTETEETDVDTVRCVRYNTSFTLGIERFEVNPML